MIGLLLSALLMTAPMGAGAVQDPSVAMADINARGEAAGAAMEAKLEALKPRADAIRADASLTDEAKRTQLAALFEEARPELDAFDALIQEAVRAQMTAEGQSADETNLAVEIARQHIGAAIAQNFVEGPQADEIEDVPAP